MLRLTPLLLLIALPAAAETTLVVRDPNPLQLAGAVATADAAPSTQGYVDAGRLLHQTIDTPYTGNADADYVRSMIPLRRSALAMARVEAEYGRDPALRRAAEDSIAAEGAEIDRLIGWLAAHGD